MNLDRIRTGIEEAVSVSVQGIQLAGIAGAEAKNVAISSKQLQQIAAQLEQHGRSEMTLSAQVELFLRVSNTDLLSSIQCVSFRVTVSADENGAQAVASNEQSWSVAWERGIEPIKPAALQSMKEDVWRIDPSLSEDSSTFQPAMILFASELVRPWSDRIATFLRYSPGLVQVVAARLYEGRIWENEEVRSEAWFDPHNGGVAFIVDLMVAEGVLIRRWSEEDQQFAYRAADLPAVSYFAV